jgi:hypothetical protein
MRRFEYFDMVSVWMEQAFTAGVMRIARYSKERKHRSVSLTMYDAVPTSTGFSHLFRPAPAGQN